MAAVGRDPPLAGVPADLDAAGAHTRLDPGLQQPVADVDLVVAVGPRHEVCRRGAKGNIAAVVADAPGDGREGVAVPARRAVRRHRDQLRGPELPVTEVDVGLEDRPRRREGRVRPQAHIPALTRDRALAAWPGGSAARGYPKALHRQCRDPVGSAEHNHSRRPCTSPEAATSRRHRALASPQIQCPPGSPGHAQLALDNHVSAAGLPTCLRACASPRPTPPLRCLTLPYRNRKYPADGERGR